MAAVMRGPRREMGSFSGWNRAHSSLSGPEKASADLKSA